MHLLLTLASIYYVFALIIACMCKICKISVEKFMYFGNTYSIPNIANSWSWHKKQQILYITFSVENVDFHRNRLLEGQQESQQIFWLQSFNIYKIVRILVEHPRFWPTSATMIAVIASTICMYSRNPKRFFWILNSWQKIENLSKCSAIKFSKSWWIKSYLRHATLWCNNKPSKCNLLISIFPNLVYPKQKQQQCHQLINMSFFQWIIKWHEQSIDCYPASSFHDNEKHDLILFYCNPCMQYLNFLSIEIDFFIPLGS